MGRVLIFGSGFLVKHITNEFINNGDKVKIIYNNHPLEDYYDQHKLNDINVIDTINHYKPNFILFAKGNSFVNSNTDIKMSIENNVTPIINILEEISHNFSNMDFIKKILIIGSAAEYGNITTKPFKETDPLSPSSIYGLSKIFLYKTSMYYHNKGLPIIYCRQFNAIGTHQRELFVLSAFAKQLVLIESGKSEPIISVGDLNCERDFIDGRDAAKAYRMIFDRGENGEVYNIGSGVSTSIGFLLKAAIGIVDFGKDITINSNVDKLKKNGLSDKLLSDNTKIKKLGFVSQYTIEQTIEDTINYWRECIEVRN